MQAIHCAPAAPDCEAVAKGINQVVADALSWYMEHAQGGPISNRALAKKCGLSEGTIRNALKPANRDDGNRGKEASIKLTELSRIAEALGVTVADLVQDASPEAREERQRLAAALAVLQGKQPKPELGELSPATGTHGH